MSRIRCHLKPKRQLFWPRYHISARNQKVIASDCKSFPTAYLGRTWRVFRTTASQKSARVMLRHCNRLSTQTRPFGAVDNLCGSKKRPVNSPQRAVRKISHPPPIKVGKACRWMLRSSYIYCWKHTNKPPTPLPVSSQHVSG